MDIIVCIKQVPDTAEIKIDPKTNTLMREGVPSIINPFDLNAVEEALQIRDSLGDGKVTVLTMGPPQAESALREAISMGADEAVLLSDRAFAGADTWATSYTLARAIKQLGADIVFCGKQAIDGDTAQVGPETAEFLNIPHVAYVKKVEEVQKDSIRVQRLMDEGYDVVESTVPVLLTVVKELNVPRMPSLKGKMAAKKTEIKKMGMAEIGADENDLGMKGSPTQVRNIFAPQFKTERRMLDGTPEEQVNFLVKELKESQCL
ncbi:MAG TPA: electron transfer flavoprotein subunit beta/FixA family protein [Nitrospirae bacterium]|nr:acryloyl-CoA reductase electron transfer subunit gamma [bacterium BMS3Abin10]GBE38677.1 acryloyl-CoA reductase electron transfer subunit gamma [bacterium BMS3Bbin08]HDH51486.1 electron transfer flavoprotein subunit beta/FixA family protein [Nitrospirota bacterium]HDK17423.1 electron transfer flavoprotein subunit beta/FixA family protein [Nitrospirota bacterium]HDK41137.1 electron transfer flavoprotein subunit beta/FixA family protein [Nitrospirota bacterium]